jgi:hypothetical protein
VGQAFRAAWQSTTILHTLISLPSISPPFNQSFYLQLTFMGQKKEADKICLFYNNY